MLHHVACLVMFTNMSLAAGVVVGPIDQALDDLRLKFWGSCVGSVNAAIPRKNSAVGWFVSLASPCIAIG